jgi:hypothetical protein
MRILITEFRIQFEMNPEDILVTTFKLNEFKFDKYRELIKYSI